jgi:hypothetical protein
VTITAVTSRLNIGHRHILTLYPLLFIALGGLAVTGHRWRQLTFVLLLSHVVESAAVRPHYLAFFNRIASGPEHGYRLVVDSSLDWGQGLPALRDWLAHNRQEGEPVYLSYFGSAWPPHYGVHPTHFLPGINIAFPPFQPYEYQPGLYCVSATALSEVYSDFRGPWRQAWEEQWRSPLTTTGLREMLRFSRLCKYLQNRTPDGEAGYAILIYRLNAAELRAALEGPVKGW